MKTSTRIQLESAVVAVNKHLKEEVATMDTVALLRNCHPLYRYDYGRALHKEGEITEEQLKSLE